MTTFFCNGEAALYKIVLLFFCLVPAFIMNAQGLHDQPSGLYGETNIEPTQYDRCEDTDQYWQFGSKTVYNLENTFPQLPSACNPIQIFMAVRHGTRDSSSNYIKKMSKLTDLISKMDKPKMNEKDVEDLKNWQINDDGTTDRNLTIQGIRDMIGLGERVRATFKPLFDEPYDPEMYKVMSAPKSRCITSAQAFMQAVLGVEHIEDLSKNVDNHVLPNLYNLKAQLGGIVDESQINDFKKSDTMANVLSRVAEKMGLDKDVITLEQLETMFESCRHGRATDPKSNPVWCRVFSKEDRKVLEYLDDLGWYYSFGYGCRLHEYFACPLLKQLNDSFKEKADGKGPKGVFQFAHRSNMIAAAVMLGVAKDEQRLTYDNMEEMEDRKWKTSKLNPFGANTAAVLYDCGNDELMVSFYINEVLTPFELDNGDKCELCPWKLVEQTFDEKIRILNCDCNSN
ncbi:multiple inositol polyphosphate phosphatase 1-like [Adelges cooleyi]|uniref:multiple inositol polyphosphate phosphatase 1-like n=1 Tax=Adelges cooleyi TaxID=133065 RepID=UPI0021806B3A|nr:multiple inositol polyphosphate phosphatase 1-like [Adelges cooleyi]